MDDIRAGHNGLRRAVDGDLLDGGWGVMDYYNEFDPHAAQWIRNLIARGVIPAGDVDERSIEDVKPDDLSGYRRCHFFAGIGVWAYALELAGFEGACWTGSCPCQPFSAAGKGGGFADERHLWPAWHHLIRERRPSVVFGEQVASKDGLNWFDLVHADLEGSGYAVGSADLCAAGVGAPHIRQRLWFVADSDGGLSRVRELQRGREHRLVAQDGGALRVADSESVGLQRRQDDRDDGRRQYPSGSGRSIGELGDADSSRLERRSVSDGKCSGERALGAPSGIMRPGPTNGAWSAADWIGCTDGKWRPVEPGAFPLVDGAAFRVGSGSPFKGKSRAKMLKGYGNAIVAPLAATFIASAMDAMLDRRDADRTVFDAE